MTIPIKKHILPLMAAVLSGVFMYLAFPPVGDDRIAWFALVPVLIMARYTVPFVSFMWGLVAGCVFWLLSLSWLLHLSVTGTVWPLAVLSWMLLAGYSALYMGLFCGVSSYLFDVMMADQDGENSEQTGFVHSVKPLLLIILIPVVWVGFEYARSIIMGGFPWNTLGVSQYRNLAVIQIAEFGGVYAVSAVVVVMNIALTFTAFRVVDVYYRRRVPGAMRFALMAGLIICALCWVYGVRKVHSVRRGYSSGTTVRIAAIQPNTPQLKKWDEQFEYEIYDRLDRQTRLASINDPDLTVWPETAVMRPLNDDEATHKFILSLVNLGSPLLVGSLEAVRADGDDGGGMPAGWYNSSFLVEADGTMDQRYRKQHLVPFGEYVPLENHLRMIKRLVPTGFSCMPGNESTILDIPLRGVIPERRVSFGVLICFEDAFAYLARRVVRSGAEFLVNQTNDAWFDGTAAAVQHMSHCVFRCVENRVPAMRSANTGITCFIDSTGDISYLSDQESKYGQNVEGFKVSGVVVVTKESPTFYEVYGDMLFAVPCGIVSLMLLVCAWRDMKRERKRNT